MAWENREQTKVNAYSTFRLVILMVAWQYCHKTLKTVLIWVKIDLLSLQKGYVRHTLIALLRWKELPKRFAKRQDLLEAYESCCANHGSWLS